jgi:hypothetical protein
MAKRPKATDLTVDRMDRSHKRVIGQRVVARILEPIRTGSLRAGNRLPPERELIEIFGISRQSLREAASTLCYKDNMSLDELKRAVAMIGGRAISEGSGRVRLAEPRLEESCQPSWLKSSSPQTTAQLPLIPGPLRAVEQCRHGAPAARSLLNGARDGFLLAATVRPIGALQSAGAA